jgi:hypothetical protein
LVLVVLVVQVGQAQQVTGLLVVLVETPVSVHCILLVVVLGLVVVQALAMVVLGTPQTLLLVQSTNNSVVVVQAHNQLKVTTVESRFVVAQAVAVAVVVVLVTVLVVLVGRMKQNQFFP